MNSFNSYELITQTFVNLRQSGFKLGVEELLAARAAIKGGFGDTPETLAETLKILWCHSLADQSRFDPIFKSLSDRITKPSEESSLPESPISSDREIVPEHQEVLYPKPWQETVTEIQPQPALASLAVRAPSIQKADQEKFPFETYYPITRRKMAYQWRYLRCPIANGLLNLLDIDGTIEQTAHQGFYLAPNYQRREQNHVHLLMLVDQNGSMTPFHRFSRDLVETASNEGGLNPEKVDVFYFQNILSATLYQDIYLTEPIKLKTVLNSCDRQTSILIVSDAGAARGYRKLDRIRATNSFLFQLKQHTKLIAWLNPMPKSRWMGSSAEIIANLVPMSAMDEDGLSNAIDMIRGVK